MFMNPNNGPINSDLMIVIKTKTDKIHCVPVVGNQPITCGQIV